MKHKMIFLLAVSVVSMGFIPFAGAQELDKYWADISKSYFQNKVVEESSLVSIRAPVRAESGAQVPFEFNVDYPMTEGRYVKDVWVIAGANPVPLVAVFHFTPSSGRAAVATRIRLDADSHVHVVAQTSDGHYYMNKAYIKASGGCGGTVGGDDSVARQSAGQMRLAVKPTETARLNKATLMIKHPMYTGLQRDLVSQGFRPAYFINKVSVRLNEQLVLDVDTYIGLSEDPYMQLFFNADKLDKAGRLTVVARDNEGKAFSTSTDVSVN